MVDSALDWTSGALSYLIQLLALPLQAGRLAALRLQTQQLRSKQAQMLKLEVLLLRETLSQLDKAEQQLAWALSDLSLTGSRRAAIRAYRDTIERIKQHQDDDAP